MGTVNDSFSFERDTSPSARSAFSSPPKRTLFPEGVEFCRIVTTANKRTGERATRFLGVPGGFPGKRSEKSSREPTRKDSGFQRSRGSTWPSPRNSTPRWIGSA